MKELPAQRILFRAVLALVLTCLSDNQTALAQVDDSDAKQTNALLRRAYFQMLRGEFQQAVANHKLAVIADRDSVDARRHLGYSLLKLGNYKEALEQLHFLVAMAEPTTFDMCLYGEACLQSGQFSLAESWFGEALKCNSELVNARIGLAKAVAASKNKGATVDGEKKTIVDEVRLDSASEQAVSTVSASAASTGPQSQPLLSISVIPVKSKQLGNNQTHNAWDCYRGLQSK